MSPTNLSCVLTKAQSVEIQTQPTPSPTEGQVLIKVESTGICGSDLHVYNHFDVGNDPMTRPGILGHESAGTVVQVASGVTSVVVGDRVCIEPAMYCKECHNCKIGKTNICRNIRQAGLPPTPGTLVQYYACDSEYVVKIPDSLSWEEAGCIQPLAVAVQLAKRAKFGAGQTVAVFGCGPLGCLVMATARAFGVSKILAIDKSQPRIDFAKKMWADYATLSPPKAEGQEYQAWAEEFKSRVMEESGVDSWGVDVAVEATGVESCMYACVTFVHPGGVYIQAGLGRPINALPTVQIVAKELDVLGSVRYTPGCFQTAIDLVSNGKVNIKPMITAVYPLSRSGEALEKVRKGDDLKVVIMNQRV